MSDERKKFVIDRSKWRSGSMGEHAIGKGNTEMLNEQGYMCCLGQICKQLEVQDHLLLGVLTPASTARLGNMKAQLEEIGLVQTKVTSEKTSDVINSEICSKMIDINDRTEYSLDTREKMLIGAGDLLNFDIEFVGEAVSFHNDTTG